MWKIHRLNTVYYYEHAHSYIKLYIMFVLLPPLQILYTAYF